MTIYRYMLCILLIVLPAINASKAQQTTETEAPRINAPEAPQISAPEAQPGHIAGTVVDVQDGTIPGASVVLEDTVPGEKRTVIADQDGAFQFDNIKAGVAYQVTISAAGFVTWTSPALTVTAGQFLYLTGNKLAVAGDASSITVYASNEHIATEQVEIAEQQRVFGIFPNFYVTYDIHPVPLTTKLKFKLAYKAFTDPVTFVGIAFMAGIYQAGDVPNYVQGAKGYGQRFGAGVADASTDIFIGGAVFPWMFRQDPRYFYKGTGTKKARFLHAISAPYVCMGDNGKLQPNYSSIGGDLASGAISNLYYPQSNRGVEQVFKGFFITTSVRTVNTVIQEFLLRRFTPSARKQTN